MEFVLRPLTEAEEKYTYSQSVQVLHHSRQRACFKAGMQNIKGKQSACKELSVKGYCKGCPRQISDSAGGLL